MEFEEANKLVHPVEKQWHYPIMTKAGFVAETKEGIGFVRSYTYKHEDGRVIECRTGASSDYWNDVGTKEHGFWGTLEKHVAR